MSLIDKIEALILTQVTNAEKLARIHEVTQSIVASFKPCSVCQHMYPEDAMKDNTCAHCISAQMKLNLVEWAKESRELCYKIEELPASTKQTEISIKASDFSSKLHKAINGPTGN
jgi:hypothetical protein